MVVDFKLVLRTAKVSKDVQVISDSGMDLLQTMQVTQRIVECQVIALTTMVLQARALCVALSSWEGLDSSCKP